MTEPALPDDQHLAQSLRRSRLLEDAPEHLVLQAIALGPAPARQVAPLPEGRLLQRLIAVLSFDSAGQSPALVGIRGSGSDARQLLFSTQGHDIDLRIDAQPGMRWRISGQVLGPSAAGTAIITCADHHAEVAWSELTEFSFDAVPPGECTLTLRAADWELVLPSLRIGSEG